MAINTGPWVRNPSVLHRVTLEGILLLGRDWPAPVLVEGPGAAIWEAFVTARDLSEVSEVLAGIYGAPAEQVAHDIEPVIRDLQARGALLPADAPEGGCSRA